TSLAICWKACVNSLIIMSRMGLSLSVCPAFEQVRLQSFEIGAQGFLTRFDVLSRSIPVFAEKSQAAAPVQRDQRLNDMVAVDSGLVIGSGELKHGLRPEFRGIFEFVQSQGRNALEFRQHRLGQDRAKHGL